MIKKLLHNKAFVMSMVVCLALSCSMCFASGESLSETLSFTPIISAITTAITPTDIITVMAAVVAAGMGFVLAWFGIRKVLSALRKAILRGRL